MSKITFKGICPALDEILKPTYGQLIFQEQVTEIAMKIAGYDAGKADVIRKTIGRKIQSELDAMIPDLVRGFKEYGHLPDDKADMLSKAVQACASYLFNKAHSTEYGLIAYQTAYLKANYPLEYMCSLLNANMDDSSKAAGYINDCKRMGIKVLPPSIAVGNMKFIPIYEPERAIRIGLTYIKGIGNIQYCYDSRMSLTEFISANKLNKKVKENLIKAGAMDCFNMSRGRMLVMALDIDTEIKKLDDKIKKDTDKRLDKKAELFDMNDKTKKYANTKKQIGNLFNKVDKYMKDKYELIELKQTTDSYDVAEGEVETLGFTFLDRYAKYDTKGLDRFNADSNGYQYVLGEVVTFKQIKDKKGRPMAFVKCRFIDDKDGELVMFATRFTKLDEGKIYVFKIKEGNILESVAIPKEV